MSDYKVTRISEKPPREWQGDHGTIYYIRVTLEGHDRPVSIGKKSADALHVGDIVSGTINPDPTHEEDKFKADPKPFGGGAGKPAYQPKDEEAIARAVALKAAVDLHASTEDKDGIHILKTAEGFLAWLKERPEAPKDDEPHYVEGDGF